MFQSLFPSPQAPGRKSTSAAGHRWEEIAGWASGEVPRDAFYCWWTDGPFPIVKDASRMQNNGMFVRRPSQNCQRLYQGMIRWCWRPKQFHLQVAGCLTLPYLLVLLLDMCYILLYCAKCGVAMVFVELLSGQSGRFEEAVGCQGAQLPVICRISCHTLHWSGCSWARRSRSKEPEAGVKWACAIFQKNDSVESSQDTTSLRVELAL